MKRILYILPLFIFLQSCKDALVLDIKSVSFEKGDTILFGNNQDIIFNGLLDSTLSLIYFNADSTFLWQLNKPTYFKIDGKTQNAVVLDSIKEIIIGTTNSFDINRIKAITQKFAHEKDGVKYIKLNNIIKSAFKISSPSLDSLNSLIACDNDNDEVQPKLIILDRNVSALKTNGESYFFENTGTARSKKISIEFFRIFNSVLLDTTNSESFHIGDTVYYSTVKSYYTPFGASKLIIEAEEKLKVSFNKFFRAVIPKTSIDSAFSKNNSIAICVKQKVQSNTYSNEVYTANISNSNAFEFGTVDTSLKFIQTMENSLLSENNFRTAHIDSLTFFYSLLPLFLVFIFGLVVIYFVAEKNDLYESQSSMGESSKWRKYFWILFSSLFILSVGRIFIGYNLSFTPPYFSFAFPTSVIVSPLILLTVLYVWLIFVLYDNKDAVSFGYRIALAVAAIALLFSLQKLTASNFQFYYDEFKQSFKELSFFHPIDSVRKILKWEVYNQTLFALVFFLSSISLGLIFVRFSKTIFISCSVLLSSFFVFQKSSYSVTALLIALALITIIVMSFPRLVKLEHYANFKKRRNVFLLLLIPVVVVFGFALLKGDGGYFINLLLFPLMASIILFRFYKYYPNSDLGIDKRKTRQDWIYSWLIISMVAVGLFVIAYAKSSNYNPLEDTRMGSRFTSFFSFNTVHEYGTRESEKQAQFFAELCKYTYPTQHNKYDPIHPGISSFIDPVVKNDLSVPFGLIYQFGNHGWLIPILILMLVWLCILYSVLRRAVTPTVNSEGQMHITQYSLIRIYCACMIVSSGLWLIASYYNIVPFTGRLIFGLGQDSIAEVFETIFIFSYMGLIRKTEE